ncbi:capsule assembly Wzi family protein [uncultured Bacteroides sp.]|uniref:capsule assembly Wzi family protein n=1 Tax=uncultured Bacteroides sp. TaxID=162156 RepID=UPI002AABAC48|nr:capsule assembly Wzi family protein [uncultured Bacteroides sp.]
MHTKLIKKGLLLLCLLPGVTHAQSSLKSFAEFGTTIHTGDNTPLWQVSNQHGLSSLNNNAYMRGGTFYTDSCRNWKLATGLDLAVATGFTSTLVVQQAYADIYYKWIGLSIGSKELNSELLNQQLSSGGLTWSGNARPIPQVKIGILDYIRIASWAQVKAEMSYGKWTDNNYQEEKVGLNYWYTKDILYHHKSFYFRLGKPVSHWQFDLGMSLDTQFGGYKSSGGDAGDLGNSLKDFWHVLIPKGGNGSSSNLEKYFLGNFLGSEHLKLTYKQNDYHISAYLENYYDDFSGMGKLNGLDGLWGIEYKSRNKQAINGLVFEYYQTTNQSGPLHGLDDSIVKKTGGADDYYNNFWYPGWVHWGMTMANPLIASPIYNKDGDMTFKYNRVKAIHIGWSGDILSNLSYRAKISYNQTWGTPFKPTIDILENFSTFAECSYYPNKLNGWNFTLSGAFDTGGIYGDNLGLQLKIRKHF